MKAPANSDPAYDRTASLLGYELNYTLEYGIGTKVARGAYVMFDASIKKLPFGFVINFTFQVNPIDAYNQLSVVLVFFHRDSF